MSINYEETKPYNPGKIVVKIVSTPAALATNEKLSAAFIDLIENKSGSIGDFNSGQHLMISEQTQGVPTLKVEDGHETYWDVTLPELKDKATSRILRDVVDLCFVGENPAVVKTKGFSMIAYELSEDCQTVIDAWLLEGIIFPNALATTVQFDRKEQYAPDVGDIASIQVPVINKEPEFFSLSMAGNQYCNKKVLMQALKLHVFQLKKAGLATSRAEADLNELQATRMKDQSIDE